LGSLSGEPIMKLPEGTTTISGQLLHSLKGSLCLSAHASVRSADQVELMPPNANAKPRAMNFVTRISSDSLYRRRYAHDTKACRIRTDAGTRSRFEIWSQALRQTGVWLVWL
jgi:hypothetical protein